MVQKSTSSSSKTASRRRGRPRAFEPETALARAMDVFWKDGFAATSLDDLSAATGLNRPSLYGAFGDKRALYLKAYRRYREHVREAFSPLFAEAAPLRDKLRRILRAALDLYLSGEDGPRGCFSVLSASSDAVSDPEIRKFVGEAIDAADRAFERLFEGARAAGELPADADPRRLALIASAALHTLSVRARARIPRVEIEPIVEGTVEAICGPARRREEG
ncbi:MAG TPA: TetR/AcrR family transcriptional regulator [Roseiarcus sp.]|jgi:AcrR family transcriptional regulator|nr:TetR/AcrR family transcriptional regulator [Roseiarcus sp.]